MGVPHTTTKQGSDTSCRCITTQQFWHYPPRDSIRLCRSRAQSHKTTRLPLQMPVASPSDHLCFRLTGYRSEVKQPLPRVSLLRVVHRTQRNVLLTRSLFYYERIWLRNSQIEEVCRERVLSFHAFSGHTTIPALPCIHQPRTSLNPVFFFLLETSIYRHDWLNPWPLAIEQNLKTLSYL